MNKKAVALPARETKQFHFQVKAVDDEQGLIEAYGSVFGNEDQGGDVVKSGAFKRTIQNSKSRVQAGKAKYLAAMLWQHDANQPVGGWYDLSEDAHGLLCKGQIVLTTQLGRECYELIKAGVIDQFSIGYDIPSGGANYDKSSGVRNLTELRLWEVSPVTFAMNQEALLVGVKADQGQQMNGKKKPEKKTLQEHYNTQMCQDLLEDWQDIYITSLTSAMMDALKIGDQPESDISDALDAFKELVLSKFVAQAQECGLSQYLENNTYSYTPAESMMQNGSDDSYGYMSSDRTLARKAGRAISQTNAQSIQDHIDTINDQANKMDAMAKEHTKALRTAANDLATVLQGSEPAYGTDPGDAGDRQEGKSASSQQETRATDTSHSPEGTVSEEELSGFLAGLQLL